jgi:hypothetical protein
MKTGKKEVEIAAADYYGSSTERPVLGGSTDGTFRYVYRFVVLTLRTVPLANVQQMAVM